MKDIIIKDWNELQQVIFNGSFDNELMRYRTNFIYRGLNDAGVDGTVPTLNRYCGHRIELEKSLIRNFSKYAYSELGAYKGFWPTITLGQHYGLPTRLLDWSYSPLVAAHFATENIECYDRDGAILCVNFVKLRDQLPKSLKQQLEDTGSNSFTMEMLENDVPDFEALKEAKKDPYVLFYEPSNLTERITGQYSLFSVVSDPNVTLRELLDENDDTIIYRIVIPKEIKLEIRDKLDYINISERTIYPGIQGICKWMTRRYADLGHLYNKSNK